MNEKLLLGWLADRKGRGRKEDFTPEQRTKIAALSLESPEQSGLPVTHWTSKLLASEAINRGIVEMISALTGFWENFLRLLDSRRLCVKSPDLKLCIRTGLFANWA